MEKLIGLIIFLAIFIIGKIIENAQKKQPAQDKKPEPVNDKINYTKVKNKSVSSHSRSEQVTATTSEYYAPKDEIDAFLRSIGAIKEEKPARKTEPQIQKLSSVKKKRKPAFQIPKPAQQTEETIDSNILKIETPYKQIETESRFDLSLLNNKGNLKTAFILSEILKPPLTLRRFNDK